MVTLASPSSASSAAPAAGARTRWRGWTLGAAVVLVLGLAVHLLLGGSGVGERSAIFMAVLLSVLTWLAARLLAGPRVALGVVIVTVALLDLAALAPRQPAPYDDLEAFYRTDQLLSARVPVGANTETLSVLVQPVFSGDQPAFGLAGDVNGVAYQWRCPFARGIQTIQLPVSVSGPSADVHIQLTGSPSRDGDYLIVYASSRRGGFVITFAPPDPSATRCSAA